MMSWEVGAPSSNLGRDEVSVDKGMSETHTDFVSRSVHSHGWNVVVAGKDAHSHDDTIGAHTAATVTGSGKSFASAEG